MNDVKTVNTLLLQSTLHPESPAKKMRIDSAAESRSDEDDSGDTAITASVSLSLSVKGAVRAFKWIYTKRR